jgi:hypothetical protein
MATIEGTGPATGVSAAPGLWARIDGHLRRPGFAYLTIVLVQLTAVWGMWAWRDMSRGDTAAYYTMAYSWYEHGTDNIVWSPLYTTYYGSMLLVTRDPCYATMLHRLLIVFAATLLVLAVVRRLLPAGVAWLVAAWWAVLPIQFNTLYEVHLFAALPPLVCWWLVAMRDSVWNRGAALAVLATSAVLVRNEMGLAALLFGCVCVARELPSLWSGTAGERVRRAAAAFAAYGLPLAAGALLVVFFYRHSESKFNSPGKLNLREVARVKHELNMAQVYAFGYLQRHPGWGHNPWVDHQQLMTETFGRETLPFTAMFRANPRAVLSHIAWNFGLLPHGLQILLFNATAWRSNPDYIPVNSESVPALVASIVVAVVWVVGFTLLLRNRRQLLWSYVRGRGMIWLAMLCVAAVAVPVIATQRPRPSYLFALGIVLMAVTGLCVAAIFQRFALLRRAAGLVAPVALIAFLYSPLHPGAGAVDARTPLNDTIHRLRPYEALLSGPDTQFLGGEYNFEVMIYLGHHINEHAYGYDLLSRRQAGVPLDTFLQQQGINLFYVEEALLTRLEEDTTGYARAFLTPGQTAWKLIGSGDVPGNRWRLYHLERPAK